MSRNNAYASIEKRTFESALIHLLETEYGLLGGRRILELIAEDVIDLVDEFYPSTERAASGHLVWTCTADEGKKAEPGKPTEAYKTVTVLLPLVTADEVRQRTVRQKKGRGVAKERERQRVVRLVKDAAEQGGLLTLAELSVILNRGYEQVRQHVRGWEEETGELLPLKGYRMDQGSRPTHKKEIVRLYAEGMAPPDIARETGHSLKSVDRYLSDYERVKMLLQRGLDVEEIRVMIDRGRHVVLEYVELARQYHPDLVAEPGNENRV